MNRFFIATTMLLFSGAATLFANGSAEGTELAARGRQAGRYAETRGTGGIVDIIEGALYSFLI